MMLQNLPLSSGVVRLTSADVMLDTDGRDCSFKRLSMGINESEKIYAVKLILLQLPTASYRLLLKVSVT